MQGASLLTEGRRVILLEVFSKEGTSLGQDNH